MKYENNKIPPVCLSYIMFYIRKLFYFLLVILFSYMLWSIHGRDKLAPLIGLVVWGYFFYLDYLTSKEERFIVKKIFLGECSLVQLSRGEIIKLKNDAIKRICEIGCTFTTKNTKYLANQKSGFDIYLNSGQILHVTDGMEKIEELRISLTQLTNKKQKLT